MRNNIQQEISKLKEEQSKDLVLKSFKTQAKNTNFNYLDVQRPDFVEIAKKSIKAAKSSGLTEDNVPPKFPIGVLIPSIIYTSFDIISFFVKYRYSKFYFLIQLKAFSNDFFNCSIL